MNNNMMINSIKVIKGKERLNQDIRRRHKNIENEMHESLQRMKNNISTHESLSKRIVAVEKRISALHKKLKK